MDGSLPSRRKLDVFDYHRMAEAGILGEDDRVELIDGDIIEMAPIGTHHATTVNRFNRMLVMACGERAIVSVQNSVRLDLYNEPQPDFAVLRPKDDWYWDRPAGPADVLLLIEVANTSLRFDQTVKLPLYARLGIGEVWIIDLGRGLLDAYRDPADGAYTTTRTHRPGEAVALALAPEIVVTLAALSG